MFDWFTIIAQIINFLILIWMLKRFLYKPILDSIDAREAAIRKKLEDAAARKKDATAEKERFEARTAELESHLNNLVAKAEAEAKDIRKNMLDDLDKEYQEIRVKKRESLKAEEFEFKKILVTYAKDEVFEISQKLLKDLSSSYLEERMFDVFADRLENMDPKAKKLLKNAIEMSSNPIVFRTVFKLTDTQKNYITSLMSRYSNRSQEVDFITSSDPICGIELVADEYKLAWNTKDYLDSLSSEIEEMMKEKLLIEQRDSDDSIGNIAANQGGASNA